MTASAIALHTDAKKNGKPLVGLAFDSIGRYGHGGLLRERFIPRLLAADPDELCRRQRRHRSRTGLGRLDGEREAGRTWRALRRGRPDRRGAVGSGRAKSPTNRCGASCRGTHGDRGLQAPRSRSMPAADIIARPNDVAASVRRRARAIGQGHRRFKIKIGGAALQDDLRRVEAVLAVLGARHEPRRRRQRHLRSRHAPIEYLDALAPYPLAWIEEPVHPLDFALHPRYRGGQSPTADCDRREPVLPRRCPEPAAPWRPAEGSRHPAVRHLAQLRHRRISAHPRRSRRAGWRRDALRAACRPSAGDACGRGPRLGTCRSRDGYEHAVRQDHGGYSGRRRRRPACRTRRAPGFEGTPVFAELFYGVLN